MSKKLKETMVDEITIYPPKKNESKQNKKWDDVLKHLPKHEFLLCLVAPPRSGKSTTILNLIYNPKINYKNRFDNIIYISPSLMGDKTLEAVRKDVDIQKFTNEKDLENIDVLLDEIMKQQLESKESLLLILDDMVGNLKSKKIGMLSSRYRHYNMSIILVSQNYRMLDSVSRNSASHWIMFRSENLKERSKINEELSSFPDFMKHYLESTEKRYNFLYADINDQRLMKNFNEVLWERK
jgi:hypothetical protein